MIVLMKGLPDLYQHFLNKVLPVALILAIRSGNFDEDAFVLRNEFLELLGLLFCLHYSFEYHVEIA